MKRISCIPNDTNKKRSILRHEHSSNSSGRSSSNVSDGSDIEETSSGANQNSSKLKSRDGERLNKKSKRIVESKFSPSFFDNFCRDIDGGKSSEKSDSKDDENKIIKFELKEDEANEKPDVIEEKIGEKCQEEDEVNEKSDVIKEKIAEKCRKEEIVPPPKPNAENIDENKQNYNAISLHSEKTAEKAVKIVENEDFVIERDGNMENKDNITNNEDIKNSEKIQISTSEFITSPGDIPKTRAFNPLSNFKTSNIKSPRIDIDANSTKDNDNGSNQNNVTKSNNKDTINKIKMNDSGNNEKKSQLEEFLKKSREENFNTTKESRNAVAFSHQKSPIPRGFAPQTRPLPIDQTRSILKSQIDITILENRKNDIYNNSKIPNKNNIINNYNEKKPIDQPQKQRQQIHSNRGKQQQQQKAVYEPPKNEPRLNSIFDIPTSETNEPFVRDQIVFEVSQAEMRDAFVFMVHEEGNRLYLFCKYCADQTQFGTICVCITSPSYCLQFMPTFEAREDQVEAEVEAIAKSCGGGIVQSKKWLTKRAINSPSTTRRYLEVELSSKCNIANVPVKGNTYEAVSGSTLSLAEQFVLKKNLKGGKWISVHCSQSPHLQTSIPMYTTHNSDDIEVEKGSNMAKPSMNICCFSTFEREGKIIMITMRIFFQWNYETMSAYKGLSRAKTLMNTFILAPEVNNASNMITPSTNAKDGNVFCHSESELLQGFAEKLEICDIDVLCSYDLVNHDLPLILRRMKANNIQHWSKLGRHYRTVLPKSLSLITSGRMLLDLKMSFKNLLGIESDNFSDLVRIELNIDRPILNFDDQVSLPLGNSKLMNLLISLSKKDTNSIKRILEKRNLIVLSEHIARVTGHQWSQVMSEPPEAFVESLFVLSFFKKSFVIPDKKQKAERYKFKESMYPTKPGFTGKQTALISCEFLLSKIIQKKNLCFSTLDQIFSDKVKGILPSVINEFLNTYSKLENDESKRYYRQSIGIILHMIKRYFEFGSQRFPVEMIGRFLEGELKKLIDSLEETAKILVFNDDELIVENENIDDMIAQFNSHNKHMQFTVINQFSRILVLDSGNYIGCSNDKVQTIGLNLYRSDWCPATNILIDNILSIVMKSDDIDSDLFSLAKEFPDLTKLSVSDFAITVIPPDETPSASDPFFEIYKKYGEKGKFLKIEGKITYIHCNGNVIKSPDDVRSFDEIDMNWYKTNQFVAAAILLLKQFNIFTIAQINEFFSINVNNLDTDDRLSFKCHYCDQRNIFQCLNGDCLHCQNCGTEFKWKFLANSLTRSILSFVDRWARCSMKCDAFLCKEETVQVPFDANMRSHHHRDPCNNVRNCEGNLKFVFSSTDIYEYLLIMEDLFEEGNNNDSDSGNMVQEARELGIYMRNFVATLKSFHGFEKVSFSTIITATQTPETQIINDVCSFLDE